MAFYDLDKAERKQLATNIHQQLAAAINNNAPAIVEKFFADEDTYIRKAAYLAIGRIYKQEVALRSKLLSLMKELFISGNNHVRQTLVNAAGEIGIFDFDVVAHFFDEGLFDPHHSVRNAVIGSIKKMGEKNPAPVLAFAARYLHHADKEIRREICHGIELRGRTHPQDILPLLQQLEFDTTARVRKTLVHVLGQIAYKKGCLEIVVEHLKTWENKTLVEQALQEIISVHERYKNFATKTQQQAIDYIQDHYY